MIHFMTLLAGHWSELDPQHREPGRKRAPESLVWLAGEGLDASELQLARQWLTACGVDEATASRLLDDPRGHMERGEDYLALVLDTATVTGSACEVATGHIVAVLARGVVVTVCPQASPLMRAIISGARQQVHVRGREAEFAIAGALIEGVLAGCEDAEETLSKAISDLEQQIFSTRAADPVERIYQFKRQVSRTAYVVGTLSRPLERLTEMDSQPFAERAARAKMHRMTEWAHRLGHLLDADDRMLGDMLQVHLTQTSVRQNEDMRKISAWAGLVAVPTLISGVYGMNFTSIPWLSEPWGFAVVMGAMALVCVVLYRVFKRSGWL